MAWISKRKYNINGIVGVIHQRGKLYTLVDGRGTIHPIDETIAAGIRDTEEKHPLTGRPELYPGVEIEAHTITLPVAYWQKLQQPYSRAIGELIEK